MEAGLPPSSQYWLPRFRSRRRALPAFPALEIFSPTDATAGRVDGASVRAVVLVPGRRLLAADVHCAGRRVVPGHDTVCDCKLQERRRRQIREMTKTRFLLCSLGTILAQSGHYGRHGGHLLNDQLPLLRRRAVLSYTASRPDRSRTYMADGITRKASNPAASRTHVVYIIECTIVQRLRSRTIRARAATAGRLGSLPSVRPTDARVPWAG